MFILLEATEKVLKCLAEYYDIPATKVQVTNYGSTAEDRFDRLTIVGNEFDVSNITDAEDMASYIYNVLNYSNVDLEDVSIKEDLEYSVLYKYKPEVLGSSTEESKLTQIASYEPYCKIKDDIITSKDEDTKLYLVTFNVDENKDLNLPEFALDQDYIVFIDDLVPVEEKKQELIEESVDVTGIDTSTALLTALNSEKEAVSIYETLLGMSLPEDEKSLLEKILEDEKEHISLLAGLQSSKLVSSVSEDNKEDLDSYAEDIIEG